MTKLKQKSVSTYIVKPFVNRNHIKTDTVEIKKTKFKILNRRLNSKYYFRFQILVFRYRYTVYNLFTL